MMIWVQIMVYLFFVLLVTLICFAGWGGRL